jgi:alpha-amylase
MSKICLYFELHQPYRLEEMSIFNIGNDNRYFDDDKSEINRRVFQKVARKSYVPMLNVLKQLVDKHDDFKFTFSVTGVFLEQAKSYAPIVIELLQSLVKTGQVEVLSETYHHSLASLYSPSEFEKQIEEHRNLIQELFKVTPEVFRNTELIYSNDIAQMVENLGFSGMITEAVDRYLHGNSRTQVFSGLTKNRLPLLLKHAQLSDDVAFRFSDKSWISYPLTVDKYLEWVEVCGENEIINLFMDFETFGEHQWEDTGIFEFFKIFVAEFLKKPWNSFVNPSEIFEQLNENNEVKQELPIYDVPEPISWADVDRDLTAWIDNPLQHDTLRIIYELEDKILKTGDKDLLRDWRFLQTSDHFYYMCTKWAADGDVHAYFSPYSSPYEAYRRYSVVLADLKERLI